MRIRALPFAVTLVVALALALLGQRRDAAAQSATTGAIQGLVTDAATGDPLAGVTVVITSEALQGAQTTFTDDTGQYKATNLPPGTYQITFYYADVTVRRTDVPVSINKTTPGYVKMDTSQAGGEVIVIDSRAPAIDPTSSTQGVTLDDSYTRNIPVPGRTFEAALDAAPGASSQSRGSSFSGSSALENQFVVDGVNTTELDQGGVGTSVVTEFIEEIEILTGGYNAEYGRSTGAVVNVATKSGSNELHGSLFGYASPGGLVAGAETVPAETSSIDGVSNLVYETDFGFELGGPILKDRLWFYVGLAPHLRKDDLDRVTKRRTDCRTITNGQLSACDPALADGIDDIDPATGYLIYEEIDRSTIGVNEASYPFVTKLNFAASPEHQGQIGLLGTPLSGEEIEVAGTPEATRYDTKGLSTDLAAKWTSKFNDNKTEVEAVVGWHHSSFKRDSQFDAANSMPRQNIYNGNLFQWSALGGESMKTLNGCADGTADDPYPLIVNCPDGGSGYSIGGPGDLIDNKQDRYTGRLSGTQRVTFGGNHEFKMGADIEDNRATSLRGRSGDVLYDVYLGDKTDVQRFVELPPGDDLTGFDQNCGTIAEPLPCAYAPATDVVGETLNWAAYLRDSWQVLPNLTVNLGVRYEEQRMRYAEAVQERINPLTGKQFGKNALKLDNMWAPRFGVIYDWTKEGRSKLYAHYGRFFEAVPMSLNRINLGGESTLKETYDPSTCGAPDDAVGGPDGPSCIAEGSTPVEKIVGGTGILVAPGTKGQFMDEVSAGVEYEVFEDLKVGLSVQRRWLGRVLEDVSPDGTNTYVLANPGEWSSEEEKKLQRQIDNAASDDERAQLEHLLDVYRDIRRFDTPTRTYDALTVSAAKRFADSVFLQTSYTYSRARGNFPGIFSPDVDFVAPNISGQYDLFELIANRDGPAPQDRPHLIKLDGFYIADLEKAGEITVGSRFRAQSGTPIDALAGSAVYGQDESFVLPRGTMGRTSFDTSLDVHLAYGRELGYGMSFEVFADVFNLVNTQTQDVADETYTIDTINPIVGGSYEDLLWGKTLDFSGAETSSTPNVNRNFRKAESRRDPLTARLGARLVF